MAKLGDRRKLSRSLELRACRLKTRGCGAKLYVPAALPDAELHIGLYIQSEV